MEILKLFQLYKKEKMLKVVMYKKNSNIPHRPRLKELYITQSKLVLWRVLAGILKRNNIDIKYQKKITKMEKSTSNKKDKCQIRNTIVHTDKIYISTINSISIRN